MGHLKSVSLLMLVTFFITGCESQQAKVDRLQKQYNELSQQYGKDCAAEYTKAKPEFSDKCKQESEQMTAIFKQLQAERNK